MIHNYKICTTLFAGEWPIPSQIFSQRKTYRGTAGKGQPGTGAQLRIQDSAVQCCSQEKTVTMRIYAHITGNCRRGDPDMPGTAAAVF